MTALPSDLRQLVEFSRTGYRTCAVFLLQDRDAQRVCRLYSVTKTLLLPDGVVLHSVHGQQLR
jgi:hypothetical protein